MATALIGDTGFVGGAIARSWRADDTFNSTTIESIAGRQYDLVVSAGAYAEKWRINQDPGPDERNVHRLVELLEQVHIARLVLISTVDVFPNPVAVDERSDVPPSAPPYGRHRLWLEEALRKRFKTLIVRLPALYGPGLKKNALFDLIHHHQLDRLNGASQYQFYAVDRLWNDITTALDRGLETVHLVTEPIGLVEIARDVFGMPLPLVADAAVRYDVRTAFAPLFGGRPPYLESASDVLDGIRQFVDRERSAT